eukprot:EG_transcript_8957
MEEAALLLESHRATVVDEPGQERYSHAMGVIAQLVDEVQEREQQLLEAIHHGQNLLAELCELRDSQRGPAAPSPSHSRPMPRPPETPQLPPRSPAPHTTSDRAMRYRHFLSPMVSPGKKLLQSEISRLSQAVQGQQAAAADASRRCEDLGRRLDHCEAERDGAAAACQRLQAQLQHSEADRSRLEAAMAELQWDNAQLHKEVRSLLATLTLRDGCPPSRSTCSVATWTEPAWTIDAVDTMYCSSPSSEVSPPSVRRSVQQSCSQKSEASSLVSSPGLKDNSLDHVATWKPSMELSPECCWPRRLFAVEATEHPTCPRRTPDLHQPQPDGRAEATTRPMAVPLPGSPTLAQKELSAGDASHEVLLSALEQHILFQLLRHRRSSQRSPARPPRAAGRAGPVPLDPEGDGVSLLPDPPTAVLGLGHPRPRRWASRLQQTLLGPPWSRLRPPMPKPPNRGASWGPLRPTWCCLRPMAVPSPPPSPAHG